MKNLFNNEHEERLLKNCLEWACNLSTTEAWACIEAYKRGDAYSGEAVNHFGGVNKCMDAALERRQQLIMRAIRS